MKVFRLQRHSSGRHAAEFASGNKTDLTFGFINLGVAIRPFTVPAFASSLRWRIPISDPKHELRKGSLPIPLFRRIGAVFAVCRTVVSASIGAHQQASRKHESFKGMTEALCASRRRNDRTNRFKPAFATLQPIGKHLALQSAQRAGVKGLFTRSKSFHCYRHLVSRSDPPCSPAGLAPRFIAQGVAWGLFPAHRMGGSSEFASTLPTD
jgi:hypothetical protein